MPLCLTVALAICLLVPAVLNTLSARIIGRAETYVVVIKVLILMVFVAVGIG